MRRSCELWTNFAKYGNPPNSCSFDVRWEPVHKILLEKEKFVLNYLEMDNDQLINAINPDNERIEFWRSVYDEYNGGIQNAKL